MKSLQVITVIAATIAVPSAAFAVDDESRSRSQRDGQQTKQQTEQRTRDSQTLRAAWRNAARGSSDGQTLSTSGDILRMKKVELKGRDASHTVVLLRTERGRMGVVDLGPVKQLESLKLQQGDRIEVRGKPVRINKRGVLMAESIRKSGNRVGVDRMKQPVRAAKQAIRQTELRQVAARRRANNSEQRSMQTRKKQTRKKQTQRGHLMGKIVRTKQVDVRGTDEKQLVVLVETERGNRIPVDLGPTSRLKPLQLSSGDRIRVNGFVTKFGDKRLVVAEQLVVARGGEGQQDREGQRNRGGSQADRSRGNSPSRR